MARVNERKEGAKAYYRVAKSLVSVTTVVSSVDGEDNQAKNYVEVRISIFLGNCSRHKRSINDRISLEENQNNMGCGTSLFYNLYLHWL
jgi:hypothetical protein